MSTPNHGGGVLFGLLLATCLLLLGLVIPGLALFAFIVARAFLLMLVLSIPVVVVVAFVWLVVDSSNR